MKHPIFSGLLLAFFLASPVAAGAATFVQGDEFTLPAQETVQGNLYAAGGVLTVSGSVDGDAFIAGGTVVLTGNVRDDLAVAGGSVSLLGNVGDDVRVAGGNVTIGGEIGGEIIAAGGLVHILPGAVIHGDVLTAGGQVILEGVSDGNLTIYADDLSLRGSVGGDVKAEIERLEVTSAASVSGILAYTSPTQGTFDPDAILGGIDHTVKTRPVKAKTTNQLDVLFTGILTAVLLLALIKAVTFTLLALFMALRFPKTTTALTDDILTMFGGRLVLGIAIMVVTPILLILLTVSVIGAGFAGFGAAAFAVLCALAGIMTAPTIGTWVLRLTTKDRKRSTDWKAVILGTVLTLAVMLVPIVGLITVCIFYLATLGSISHGVWLSVRAQK